MLKVILLIFGSKVFRLYSSFCNILNCPKIVFFSNCNFLKFASFCLVLTVALTSSRVKNEMFFEWQGKLNVHIYFTAHFFLSFKLFQLRYSNRSDGIFS